MDVATETCEFVCRACGEVFVEWEHHTSRSLTCPRCGHDLRTDPGYLEDGRWALDLADDRDQS